MLPDARYRNPLIGRFIRMLMYDGKLAIAESIMYRALDELQQKTQQQDAVAAFQRALENVRPVLEVKSRRVGGATYQVPVEVRSDRGISIAMRWIRDAARLRKGVPMEQRLAQELVDAYQGQGTAVKKKEDTHKMAEANRAFAHYRW